MSWNSYVDNIIAQSAGQCDKACIIGLNGSLWTTADNANNLNISSDEAVTLGRVISSEDLSSFQANGVHICGEKYQFLREDEGIVYAKKKDLGCITLHKSKSAIVIGHTKEGGVVGSVNKGVAVIAEYLESLNM